MIKLIANKKHIKFILMMNALLQIFYTFVFFLKTYVCMHSIGVAAHLDKFTLHDDAATGGLGVRRA